MFWNKIFPFSLKLRLALTFALLFFLSCAAVFVLSIFSVIYIKNRSDLEEMRNIADNIEKIYILGGNYNSINVVRSGSECPEELQNKIYENYPDIHILYYLSVDLPDSIIKGSQKVYAFRDEKFFEIIPLENGGLSSREINPKHDMRNLARYFVLVIGEYPKNNIILEIRNPDHSPYLISGKLGGKSTIMIDSKNQKYYQSVQMRLPDGKKILVYKKKYHISRIGKNYTAIFFLALFFVALTGILVSWLIAARFIRGVKRMTSEMRRISASGNYSYQISRKHMDQDLEIRELMETFNEMNEKTNVLMEDLKMVSNNVAHDLRTPITRISGTMEELLRDRSLPEKVVESCASAAEECMHMKSLINMILDISRVNANPDLLPKESVDLRQISENFCDIMQAEAERKNLQFQVTLPQEPVMILANRMSVQRIISNLVENALKFTDSGAVSLLLEQQNSKTILQISDTGCGIPEQDLTRIFDRFYRGDASRNYPGNGLGLSLVLAFVKAHGWEISCESTPGKGSTFTVTIPKA